MNMSVWQFVALVAALAVVYLVYHYWWVDQERNQWIRGMNNWVYHAEEGDLHKNDPPPPTTSGWGS